MVAPTLVPKSRQCKVCMSVAAVEHVTMLLFDPETNARLPNNEAVQYLLSIGMKAARRTLDRRVNRHAEHVGRALTDLQTMAAPGDLVPMRPEGGDPNWVSANAQGIAFGMEALALSRGRLIGMEDSNLLAAIKIGQNAAKTRGDWEAKGRQMAQKLTQMRLQAGLEE